MHDFDESVDEKSDEREWKKERCGVRSERVWKYTAGSTVDTDTQIQEACSLQSWPQCLYCVCRLPLSLDSLEDPMRSDPMVPQSSPQHCIQPRVPYVQSSLHFVQALPMLQDPVNLMSPILC